MIDQRKYVVQGIFLVVALVFIVQLFAIQVADKTYRDAANKNIILEEIEYPFRGPVFDRHGALMVANKPEFDLW